MDHKECVLYKDSAIATVSDTPREYVWTEYNRRKAKLFRELGHGPEYDRELKRLIDEMGV